MEKLREKKFYRERIAEMVGEIENQEILMKIYTVVKTHLKMLKEKEREA